MTADVVETSMARTYSVPRTVVASAGYSLGHAETPHHDMRLAQRLAGGRVEFDDVVRIHTADQEDGGYALRGGQIAQRWASKIIEGARNEYAVGLRTTLARYDYDPEQYAYAGITASGDEDFVVHVVRFPHEETSLQNSEVLTENGWRAVEFDFAGEDKDTYGVAMDADLLAFTASALIEERLDGVLLSYGEPLCFLPWQPLLASGPVSHKSKNTHVYAIVDANDTTAVMDLIMMMPGEAQEDGTPVPQVFRRNGGMWQLDNTLLESFMSPNPPPIVELQDTVLNQVMAQVDASGAQNLVTDDEGVNPTPGPRPLSWGDEEGIPQQENGPKAAGPEPAKAANAQATGSPTGQTRNKTSAGKSPGAKKPPENREKRTPEDAEEGPDSRPPLAASAFYAQNFARLAQARNNLIAQASHHYYTGGGYASGFSLTAAIEYADSVYSQKVRDLRWLTMEQARELKQEKEARIRELQNVVIPVTAGGQRTSTAAPGVHTSPGQQKAESLRKYWVRGKGSVKIRWGTPNDFTRCVRQLRKYLGTRAEGWCSLRHREAVGFWPGDKKNTGPTHGAVKKVNRQ